MSPYARTKQYFEALDCPVVKLEYWNHFAKRRIDVWAADMLVRQGSLGLAIQVTDSTSHGKHVTKAMTDPKISERVKNWLKIGICYYVYSWGLKGARGDKKKQTLRITQLVLDEQERVVEL